MKVDVSDKWANSRAKEHLLVVPSAAPGVREDQDVVVGEDINLGRIQEILCELGLSGRVKQFL